jgi:flagellar hook protein FlgE
VLYGTHQGITRFFYTRAGQLRVDRDGYLINPEGLRVQGYMADEEGNIISVLGDIQITALTALPNPTSKVQIDGNLNSESTPIPGGFGIDAADNGATDPTGTSNFSTSVYIYDSLGSKHRMDIYFTFLGDPNGDGYSDWQWAATVISEELQAPAGADEELTVVGLGYLNYDTDGALYDTVNPGGYPAAFDITGLQFEGASPQDISVDLGTSIQAGGTGLDGVMQFDDPFNVSFQQQDGYPLGTLQSFNIDTNGVIVGTYTNGVVRNLAQIALATFTAENGLMSAGGNLFIDTVISGPALVGGAGAGGRGNIQSSSLEQSNVDLAAEFVRMISAQRGFQANSRTITTVDALLQELLTLKR